MKKQHAHLTRTQVLKVRLFYLWISYTQVTLFEPRTGSPNWSILSLPIKTCGESEPLNNSPSQPFAPCFAKKSTTLFDILQNMFRV